ncbi:response regulator [Variovorax sp. GT1P44]|uniref:response regulator n=1 Tax=Variovorax sp. GT1P44 TaxID=3443742 RepID=UPI003F48CEAF
MSNALNVSRVFVVHDDASVRESTCALNRADEGASEHPDVERDSALPTLPRVTHAGEVLECIKRGRRFTREGKRAGNVTLSEPAEASAARPLVSVIDDDESVRESLPDLLKAFGFSVRTFASAEDFLTSDCMAQTRCVLLDIAMPGMTGSELQEALAQRLPIVFITAHADEATRSRVISAGAVACLLKPFTEESLLDALNTATGRAH